MSVCVCVCVCVPLRWPVMSSSRWWSGSSLCPSMPACHGLTPTQHMPPNTHTLPSVPLCVCVCVSPQTHNTLPTSPLFVCVCVCVRVCMPHQRVYILSREEQL